MSTDKAIKKQRIVRIIDEMKRWGVTIEDIQKELEKPAEDPRPHEERYDKISLRQALMNQW